VFYHATCVDNATPIISERKVSANKGNSVCQSSNGFVSLSDRITRGIVEFFGNVIFEFDALSLYDQNPSLAPRDYAIAENDVERYDELPFFENEWCVPGTVTFGPEDINRVLFVTSKGRAEPGFQTIVDLLEHDGMAYLFVPERHLPDSINSDTARYFFRLENWSRFGESLGSHPHLL